MITSNEISTLNIPEEAGLYVDNKQTVKEFTDSEKSLDRRKEGNFQQWKKKNKVNEAVKQKNAKYV